ncbi:MAG: hypothetical protein WCL23_05895 [Candidatus Moraniibacteriota bacterium]
MKTNIKMFGVLSLLLAFWFAPVSVQAATTTTTAPAVQQVQAITLATVNLLNAKLISQDGNTIKVSFDVFNRENVQPQVIYAIQLIKANSSDVMDEKVFADDVLSVGSGETVYKEITYVAPEYLSGNFSIKILLRNEKGLSLGSGILNDVALNNAKQGIEILTSTCSLGLKGDNSGKKYTLREGVSITKDETLVATCDAVNGSGRDITVTPQFRTYFRSTLGTLVGSEKQAAVSFKNGEKKSLSFELPKAANPQAYDVAVQFLDDQQKNISNPVAFHYVLSGASASIQNLRLDKDYYSKGDTAKILFSWSGSADSFPGSRIGSTDIGNVSVELTVKNGTGGVCVDRFTKALDSAATDVQSYDLPIAIDCANPKISAAIKDSKGNILDKSDFTVASKNAPAQASTGAAVFGSASPDVLRIILIALVALPLIFFVIYAIKKKRILGVFVFFLSLSLSFVLGSQGAKADTFQIRGMWATMVVDINMGSTFAPGDTINVTSGTEAYYQVCYNTAARFELSGKINGVSKKLVNFKATNTDGALSYSESFTAPNAVGSYYAKFDGTVSSSRCGQGSDCNSYVFYETDRNWSYVVNGSMSIPYTVVVPAPVNGACGSANSNTPVASLNANSPNLCEANNTVDAFSGTGPWTWTCIGKYGGSKSPTCSVPGIPPSVLSLCVVDGVSRSAADFSLEKTESRELHAYYGPGAENCNGTEVTANTTFSRESGNSISVTDPGVGPGLLTGIADGSGVAKAEYMVNKKLLGTDRITATIFTPCVSDCAVKAASVCKGASVTGSCGETCTGTRSCDQNWKEVAPTGN